MVYTKDQNEVRNSGIKPLVGKLSVMLFIWCTLPVRKKININFFGSASLSMSMQEIQSSILKKNAASTSKNLCIKQLTSTEFLTNLLKWVEIFFAVILPYADITLLVHHYQCFKMGHAPFLHNLTACLNCTALLLHVYAAYFCYFPIILFEKLLIFSKRYASE